MTTMTRFVMRTIGNIVMMSVMTWSLQAPAYAGMVGTKEVIDQQRTAIDRGQLLTALHREDVRNELVAMGVDPQAAQERVAALSDAEINSLNGRIRTLPAGGDVLGVAVFIFLVLLLTDILGYTDVFPFVKKTVH
jgi:hypothetical protein